MDKEQIDLLKKVEGLTAKLNQLFNEKGKSVFSRYPLTFALLVVFGVTMVTQGIKDLLLEISLFKNQPLVMLIIGIIILIITGTLYKKLKK
ncbi:MAG: hypothetical protein WC603_00065 [Candidatus Paceibacterota bacterium]